MGLQPALVSFIGKNYRGQLLVIGNTLEQVIPESLYIFLLFVRYRHQLRFYQVLPVIHVHFQLIDEHMGPVDVVEQVGAAIDMVYHLA